jgi:hypothetical protein
LKNHFCNKFRGIFRGKSLYAGKNVRKIGPRWVCGKNEVASNLIENFWRRKKKPQIWGSIIFKKLPKEKK